MATETKPFAGAATVMLDDVYRLRVVEFDEMLWPETDDLLGEYIDASPPRDADGQELDLDREEKILLAAQQTKVAAAPFGGAIALCYPSQPDEVQLFNAAGMNFSFFSAEEKIHFMCWNERQDHLIVVTESGIITFVDANGHEVRHTQMVDDPTLCASCRNGVVVYSRDSYTLHLFHFRGGDYRHGEINIQDFFDLDEPRTMVAVPDDVSPSASVEVFMPTYEDHSRMVRIVFGEHGAAARHELCQMHIEHTITSMAISVSGERVVMASEDGNIGCSSISMADYIPMTETGDGMTPSFLAWAGEHTIAFIAAETTDEMVFFSPRTRLSEPQQEPELSYHTITRGSFVIVEPDGLRCVGLVQEHANLFFQVIPECATRVYYRFSTQLPGALLRKAYDQFIMGDAESVATMRQLTGGAGTDSAAARLATAIDEVLATAGFEFDIEQQKRLLRIAAYAKGFTPTYDAHEFVLRCKRIRALRAIRDPSVGMLMTMAQFERIPIDRIAMRLTEQRRFRLAFELCKSLGGRTDVVVSAWCRAKMQSMLAAEGAIDGTGQPHSHEDPALAKQLDERINQTLLINMTKSSSLNYIEIADAARSLNRDHLFIRLLEQEPSVANRVEALKHYGLMDQALQQAVDSGDAGLVFNCLISLSRVPAALFPKLSAIDAQRGDSVASDLASVYLTHFASASEMQKEAVRLRPDLGVHLQLLQYLDTLVAYRRLPTEKRISLADTNMMQVQSTLTGVIESCRDARDEAKRSGRKDREGDLGVMDKQLDMQATLLAQQKQLAAEASDLTFYNLSVLQTLQKIWETSVGRDNFKQRAAEFVKMFNITPKQNEWARLRAYAARNAPQAIGDMGGAKPGSKVKSALQPIAYVEVLMKMGANELAAQFIKKMPRIEDRLEYFVQCGAWSDAASECVRGHHPELLDQLRARAGHQSEALEAINRVSS